MGDPQEFVKVSTAAVRALARDDGADFEVFLPGTTGERPVLYRSGNPALSDPDFSRMSEHGVTELFLRKADFSQCQKALESNFRDILRDPTVPPSAKAEIIQTTATSVAADYMKEPVSEVGTDRAATVVDGMIESLLADPLVAAYLVQMAGHERSTASHMFAVSTLAIVLGATAYGPELDELRALGFAGLLHDLGKLSIDPAILNKKTPLTRSEVELIHQHPIESVRLIGDAPHITQPIRQMIIQHHERVDGRGYPLGVIGSDLLMGSRILSIVDSFHAMIGQRAYRAALSPQQANDILATQADRQFDGDLLRCWIDVFQRYWNEDGLATRDKKTTAMDELSTRHEHRPKPPVPKIVHQRPTRFACEGTTIVQCYYAGRLTNVTTAPDEFGAPVRDVSRTGMCLYAAHPMYRGEVLCVKICVHGEPVWVRGQVAWCRQDDVETYSIGVRFTGRISEDQSHTTTDVMTLEELAEFLIPKAKPGEDKPEVQAILQNRETVIEKNESAMKTLAGIASMPRPSVEAQRTVVILAMSGDAKVRLKAVDVLANVGSRTTREALVALLGDPHPEVRDRAVQAVGTGRVNEGADTLREMLHDEVESVAISVAGALGRLGDDSGLRLVTAKLEQGGSVARMAANALGDITGHRFSANREGIKAALRYLDAKDFVTPKRKNAVARS
ncbi:MAG: HEAT repeat domain-containing protein [Planctomycetes bacterium]|nr:HEAT repeat domain-containing protein [Planctomycetota bacterium]